MPPSMFSAFIKLNLMNCAFACPVAAQSLMPSFVDIEPSGISHFDPIQTPSLSLQTRGVLQSKQTTHIAANLSARILKANYKPGQTFKRGTPLIKFDCAQLTAEARALETLRTTAQLSHENARELYQAGAAGELEMTLAEANVDKANAELAVTNVKRKKCTIYAPYNGIVQTTYVTTYDTPALNAPLLTIMRTGTPEIKLIAPSAWMRWIKPGVGFDFTIDETGTTHSATIVRSGASVDPVSQTIELTAKFKANAKNALVGMSGHAVFPPPKAP